jgi:hypothetical protein
MFVNYRHLVLLEFSLWGFSSWENLESGFFSLEDFLSVPFNRLFVNDVG